MLWFLEALTEYEKIIFEYLINPQIIKSLLQDQKIRVTEPGMNLPTTPEAFSKRWME